MWGRNQRLVLNFESEQHAFDKKKTGVQELKGPFHLRLLGSSPLFFATTWGSHWNARKAAEKSRINKANNHLGKLQVFATVESSAPWTKRGRTVNYKVDSPGRRHVTIRLTQNYRHAWCATFIIRIYLNITNKYVWIYGYNMATLSCSFWFIWIVNFKLFIIKNDKSLMNPGCLCNTSPAEVFGHFFEISLTTWPIYTFLWVGEIRHQRSGYVTQFLFQSLEVPI